MTIRFTKAAQECIDETGIDFMLDVQRLREGSVDVLGLLGECLDGAEDDRFQGWNDYVDAVVAYAVKRGRLA